MADLTVTHSAAYGVQAYTLALTRSQGEGKAASSDPTIPASAPEQSGDQVLISPEGKKLSDNQDAPKTPEPGNNKSAEAKGSGPQPLSEEQIRQVQELKTRDVEVRAHEQAHLAAAGQYASGGPSFTYQTGADGKRYAIGGSVPIDLGKESTPEATISKMRTVKRAALAPANPSPADRQIAAQATMQELQAMQQMQAAHQTKIQSPSTGTAAGQKSEFPESSGKETVPKAFSSSSNPTESFNTTRSRMNTAYRAMASLA